jgi:chaperonin GroEL (HSP60 family)
MKRVVVAFLVAVTIQEVDAQTTSSDSLTLYPSILLDGEYVPHIKIEDVVKVGKRRFKNRREMSQYYKMIYNLKKTYPYAQIAKYKLLEINENLKTLKTDREKKEYIVNAEKELRNQFEKDLTKLTVSQGKMLIKLIDRETGRTSYELVKELKGGFSATFWQGIARLFGSNLKIKFDPQGEDKILNELIFLYEQGLI